MKRAVNSRTISSYGLCESLLFCLLLISVTVGRFALIHLPTLWDFLTGDEPQTNSLFYGPIVFKAISFCY